MLTFKEFIAEGIVKKWEVVSVDVQKANALLNAHCKSGFESIANGSVLWRGDANRGEYVAIDSSTGVRTSKDTNNLYQMMMDASTNLKHVPSRSKSLICSNDFKIADKYGSKLYAVFPEDGTKIAVSRVEDFIDQNIYALKKTVDLRQGLSWMLLNPFRLSLTAKRTSLKELDEAAAKTPFDAVERGINQMFKYQDNENMVDYFQKNHKHLLTSFANDFFTAGNLDIDVIQVGDKIVHGSVECWFSGKTVMIESSVFKQILKQMSKKKMPIHRRYSKLYR